MSSKRTKTISSLLQTTNRRSSEPSSTTTTNHRTSSVSSAFTKWTPHYSYLRQHNSTSQYLLKHILHTTTRRPDPTGASHLMSERRRREKINQLFVMLRSLIPFVTKIDKVSVLGDAVEYVKYLQRRIQELEGRYAAAGGGEVKPPSAPPELEMMIQVSIIESDGLIEMKCPYNEGLLLDVLVTLKRLRVDVTAVRSSFIDDGFFTAEFRAKVKENVNGKKASIVEVKRAITQLIPL